MSDKPDNKEPVAILSKMINTSVDNLILVYKLLAKNENIIPAVVDTLGNPETKFTDKNAERDVMVFCKEMSELNKISIDLLNRIELALKTFHDDINLFVFDGRQLKGRDKEVELKDPVAAATPKKGDPNSNLN